jgi:hypothetical protein
MEPINIAKVAHEANRAYCATLGDFSQLPWDDAPDWQKDSAFAGVNFVLNNPHVTPPMSHESWLAQKVADGWTYGPVKDAERKEHPCMVPYERLAVDQRTKDYLFISIVKALGCTEPVPQVQPDLSFIQTSRLFKNPHGYHVAVIRDCNDETAVMVGHQPALITKDLDFGDDDLNYKAVALCVLDHITLGDAPDKWIPHLQLPPETITQDELDAKIRLVVTGIEANFVPRPDGPVTSPFSDDRGPGDPNNPAIGDVYASMEIPDLVIKVTEFNAKGIGYTTRDGQNHFDLHGHFSPADWAPCDPRIFDELFEGKAEPLQS